MSMVVLSVAFPFAPVGPGAVGGAEQVLWLMDRGLLERGDRSLVIACAGSGSNAVLHAIPIPDHPWGQQEKRQVYSRWSGEVLRIVRKLRPDVLHMHGLDFVEYLAEGLSQEVRTFVTLHLPVSWYPPGALARAGVAYVCVSRSQAAAMAATGSVHVIPNGIPVLTTPIRHTDVSRVLATGRRYKQVSGA
ncbi:MAG: glycosyltransferase [Steroidobacteraceae bacterium]|nr:glycosyltransferase [Steroidobacteraceae bacterium]